jgi:hypothetical protein
VEGKQLDGRRPDDAEVALVLRTKGTDAQPARSGGAGEAAVEETIGQVLGGYAWSMDFPEDGVLLFRPKRGE